MSVLLIYGNRNQYAIKYGHSVHGNDSYFDATNSWLLSVISHYEVRSTKYLSNGFGPIRHGGFEVYSPNVINHFFAGSVFEAKL